MRVKRWRTAAVLLLAACAVAAAPATAPGEAATARYFASIRNNPSLLLAFLADMPKGGDLHNHLSGAVYAESYPQWAAEDVNSGLPLRDRTRFEPVEAVAAALGRQVLAGTHKGVSRLTATRTWAPAASRILTDQVTVPDTWLLCSGDHDVEVVRDGASTGH